MSRDPTGAPGQVTLAQAVAALAEVPAGGTPWAELISRGSLRVGLYAPRGTDPQQPHDQDEVYVVMSGRGTFRNGPVSHPFQPGDVLFVPAGVRHDLRGLWRRPLCVGRVLRPARRRGVKLSFVGDQASGRGDG